MKQNADKINALSETELSKQLKDGVEQMFRLRFQLSMGQADGLKKLRQLRKERARLLTVERQRQIDAKATGPATTATMGGGTPRALTRTPRCASSRTAPATTATTRPSP